MHFLKVGNVTLRELMESDLHDLYEWRNSDEFLLLCSIRRASISFIQFKEELKNDLSHDRYLQYIILLKKEPVGTIFVYNFNRTDGNAFITTYISKKHERRGLGVVAFSLLAHYLFKNFDLYKIYVEVYEYNKHSLSCLTKAGFIQEGRFKNHRLINGKRHDLVRLSFFSSEIEVLNNFILKLTQHKK